MSQSGLPSPVAGVGVIEASAGVKPSVESCRILVIEDTELNRRIIGGFLKSGGFTKVEFANDGREGLEKVTSFQPDLIVLDIVMPEIDGFEVCRRLREQPQYRDLPILVQTALDAPEQRGKVFEVGATDLVSKPINKAELVSRVRIHLENRMLIANLQGYRDRVESELTAARNLQVGMMPSESLIIDTAQRYRTEITSHFEPSSELGGDFWQLKQLSKRKFGVMNVDFSGHGIMASLNTFRLHTIMSQLPPPAHDPASYLQTVNERLKGLLPMGQFCTMIYGIIDVDRGQLTYAAAAAPSPLLALPGSDEVQLLEAAGVPLGITKSAKYTNRQVPFPPGATLLLYSDALTESQDFDGKELYDEGLVELFKAHRPARPSAWVLHEILDKFMEKRSRPLPDDLTIICFSRPYL